MGAVVEQRAKEVPFFQVKVADYLQARRWRDDRGGEMRRQCGKVDKGGGLRYDCNVNVPAVRHVRRTDFRAEVQLPLASLRLGADRAAGRFFNLSPSYV